MGGIGTLLGWQISEITNDIVLIKQRTSDMSSDAQKYIFTNFDITLEQQSQLLKSQRSFVTGLIPSVAGPLAFILANFF